MTKDIIIKLDNVWKTYRMGKNNYVHALKGVNLEVRKGEFLAIMGPSGSGKCVSGDTKIMLRNGSLTPIEELYKQKKIGKKVLCFDFNKGKIAQSKITDYHKRKDKLLEIKTTSGRTINTTKEHPFFSISENGLTEIKADNLNNKFIAVPRKIQLKNTAGQRLSTLSKLASEKDIFIADSRELFRKITFNKNIRAKICTSLNISTSTYDDWLRDNDIPLKKFKEIVEFLGLNLDEFEKEINYLKQTSTPNKIRIPYNTNKLLLEAYGYIAGDGWLDKDGVKIANIDEKLKKRIKFVFKQVFDIDAKEYIPTRIDFCSITLKHFFKNIFNFPNLKKSKSITLPDFIAKCSDGEIALFLRALFDCEGYVDKTKNAVMITLASKSMITALIPLFLRFGIVARYSEVRKRATNSQMKLRKDYTLSISGLENITKYEDNIGFVSIHKSERLKSHIKKTKKADTNVDIIPCTALIRNIRKHLKISIKRIKKRYSKDFWQLEGTSRNPTIKTVEFLLKVFKERLDEIQKMKPSLKLSKDLGFSKKEIKTEKEVERYIKNIIKDSSILINQLAEICKISRQIFWDKVKDVVKTTKTTAVYDLTIQEYHNFIANNIIIHNSTAVNMVGCLDIPSKGSIFLEKQNISHLHESDLAQIRGRKIGFIFQQFNLINTLTALENVKLPMIFQGLELEKREARARELLSNVGLGERINHRPPELSGGQQQRVAIARALANDPEVILADEPTGNLDSKTGSIMMEYLQKLHKEGKTIIMVTHDEKVAKTAERTEYLKDGTIVKSL
ncbi:MAG: ATP-binding cassette domain-containing protein [Nanoarchaeota archaeon]|nr:ATP-binding cassette domain-containing protein [Nanoarchaeota archaeon]